MDSTYGNEDQETYDAGPIPGRLRKCFDLVHLLPGIPGDRPWLVDLHEEDQLTERTPNRNKRKLLIGAGVLAIPSAALAWWLGSPLFLDTTVDETFPVIEAAGLPSTAPEPISPPIAEDPTEVPTEETAPPGEETTEPTLLLGGSFTDADSAHRGSGSAAVYLLEDGSWVLRFEEFEVTNGPDLHVLLVPTNDSVDRNLLDEIGYQDLGKLKGNVGNQNYEIPAEFDPDGPWTVVIYCDPFHVVFSTAQLSV